MKEEDTVGMLVEAPASPASIDTDTHTIHVGEFPLDAKHYDDRWCFTCRAKTEHEVATLAPIGEEVDTPATEIRCANCGVKDADMFPGKGREDDQPE